MFHTQRQTTAGSRPPPESRIFFSSLSVLYMSTMLETESEIATDFQAAVGVSCTKGSYQNVLCENLRPSLIEAPAKTVGVVQRPCAAP